MDFGGSTTTLPTELTSDYLDSKLSLRGAVRQVWASLAVHSLVVIVGMTLGYSAILLPQLEQPESDILIDKTDASWIASIVPIVAPLGSLLAGPVMQKMGSRATISIALMPYALGWILIAFSNGLPMLLTGRLITGFATTFGNTPCIVYITEISSPHLRPMLSATGPTMVSLGILLVYFSGWLLSWRIVAGIAASINLFCFAMLCTIPESPVWLVSRGRKDDAHKALLWFYRVPEKGKLKPKRKISTLETVVELNEKEQDKSGESDQEEAEWARRRMRAEAELRFLVAEHKRKEGSAFNNNHTSQADEQLLKKEMADSKAVDTEKCEPTKKGNSTMDRLWLIFTKPTCYKPMIILFTLFLLQQFSGIYITLFYAVGVFEEMGGGALDAYIASILVGVIRFSMSLVNIWLFKHFGRRTLCMFSACGMAIAMLVSGFYIYDSSLEEDAVNPLLEIHAPTSTLPISHLSVNFSQPSSLKSTTVTFSLPQFVSEFGTRPTASHIEEGVTQTLNFVTKTQATNNPSTITSIPGNHSTLSKFSSNTAANNIRADIKSPSIDHSNKTDSMHRNSSEEGNIDSVLNNTSDKTHEGVKISKQKKKSIIPTICMLLYVCVSMTGFLAIPWTLTAELFPTEVRSLANSLVLSLANILLFSALHVYPYMVETIKPHGVIWFFSLVSGLGVVFVFFFLPETRNRSLREIEEYFEKNTIYTSSKK